MNHGQSNSLMVTTRTETTHRLTYSVARAIDITAWQSVAMLFFFVALLMVPVSKSLDSNLFSQQRDGGYW